MKRIERETKPVGIQEQPPGTNTNEKERKQKDSSKWEKIATFTLSLSKRIEILNFEEEGSKFNETIEELHRL